MSRLVAILAILLCTVSAAQDALSAAMERIARTQAFAFGGVGFAGITSPGEKDFRIILSQPPAIALASFEKLYATGNAQAQGYALAGIRKLDPKHFAELMSSVKDSKERVATMAGCIMETRTLGAVAREIESGQFDHAIDRAIKSK